MIQDLGFKNQKIRFVFFGSSRFSTFVLDELQKAGYEPILNASNAKMPLPEIPNDTDVCIVASFGKILPDEYLKIPKHGFINVHPSLLPELRGPAPIQGTILGHSNPGVTIIKMDREMDHGPILAQENLTIEPFPDHYDVVEEKLARAGGKLLVEILPKYLDGSMTPQEQDHNKATFIKMIKKEDGLLNLADEPEINLRKVYAYSTWPGAYFFYKRKDGKEMRVIIKNAKIENYKLEIISVIPEGKREMPWSDFLRGNA